MSSDVFFLSLQEHEKERKKGYITVTNTAQYTSTQLVKLNYLSTAESVRKRGKKRKIRLAERLVITTTDNTLFLNASFY